MGMVAILSTSFVLACALGMVPDKQQLRRQTQLAFAEFLAHATVELVTRNEVEDLNRRLHAALESNPDLVSIGLRDTHSHVLICSAGDHSGNWQFASHAPITSQIQIPIFSHGEEVANLELCTTKSSTAGSLSNLIIHPWVTLGVFLVSTTFFAYSCYLPVVLRQLDPKTSIPGEVRNVLDNLSEGLLLLDQYGRIILANRAFEKLCGLKQEAFLGKEPNFFDWMDGDCRRPVQFAWEKSLKTGETVLNEYLRLRTGVYPFTKQRRNSSTSSNDNSAATFKINCSPIAEQGQIKGVMVCFEKISSPYNCSEDAKQSGHANSAVVSEKGSFLAKMGHEIRTPMNAILGFTELLRRNFAKSKQEELEFLQTIHANGTHLLNLINDILDLSKIECGEMDIKLQDCSIYEILNDVYDAMKLPAQAKGINFSLNFPETLPSAINSDARKLRQVVFNLVSNAIKFTEAGEVCLRTTVSKHHDRPMLEIEVIDSGIGMTPDQITKISTPLRQTDAYINLREGGTGLGLLICRRNVNVLGGDLAVRSVYGSGSVFKATFSVGDLSKRDWIDHRAYQDSRFTSLVATGIDSKQVPACRVLVVDDTSANRRLIELYLGRIGCRVEQAENGAEAITMIGRSVFDIVLMDMQMPVMDGYTATRQLREAGCTLPIIALTAATMREEEEKAFAAGCSGFLAKPVKFDLVADMIRLHVVAPTEGGTRLHESGVVQRSPKPSTSSESTAAYTIDSDAETNPPLMSSLPLEIAEFYEVASEFAAHARLRFGQLENNLKERNYEAIAQAAHWFKGSAGTCGFDGFEPVSVALQDAAKQQNDEEIALSYAKLGKLLRRIALPTPSRSCQPVHSRI